MVSLRGDKSAEKAYVLNTGMMSSLYESTVLEELTGVESVSTVSVFAEAEAEGIDIVRVHEGNLSEQMGSLQVSESVKEAVRTAVNAGNIVTITAENVTIGDWTGAGYIITDPSTGAGAYKISGGVGTGETDGGSLSELANLLLVTATFANAGLAAVDTIMLLMPYLTGAIVLGTVGWVLLAVMAATILIASLFVESMLIENYNRYVETGDSSYLEADAWMSIGLGVNLAVSGIMYHYMELLSARETSGPSPRDVTGNPVNKNKLNHIFGKQEHNLDAFLESFNGNQENAYKAILEATIQYIEENNVSGIFHDIIVNVNGYNITVRGAVVNDVVKIGTAFIP